VPYKGAVPATTDLMGGHVHVMFNGLAFPLPHVKSGKLRALAITAEKRSSLLPDMPTVAESGIPGFEATGWNGFLLPGRTPRALVMRLQQEIARSLSLPDVRERYTRSVIEPVGNSPEEFGRLIVSELAKWAKVAKEAGLQENN
jgi:tripartite-type tricarboxylate transporter receptor subunit TctC